MNVTCYLLRRAADRIAEDAECLFTSHTLVDGSFVDDADARGEYFDDVLLVHALRREAEKVEQDAARPDPLGEALNMGDGVYRP
jgi:hypothetical protein